MLLLPFNRPYQTKNWHGFRPFGELKFYGMFIRTSFSSLTFHWLHEFPLIYSFLYDFVPTRQYLVLSFHLAQPTTFLPLLWPNYFLAIIKLTNIFRLFADQNFATDHAKYSIKKRKNWRKPFSTSSNKLPLEKNFHRRRFNKITHLFKVYLLLHFPATSNDLITRNPSSFETNRHRWTSHPTRNFIWCNSSFLRPPWSPLTFFPTCNRVDKG